ncbi:MAG TPA: VOC family protein [Bacillota bacterium]|nr:VOC family protein [Bacillota bacterium]HOG52930.1 VOC family protein [Bacillota bacterium]
MNFKIIHTNLNVTDLDRSIAFYSKALGLAETRRKEAQDGSYKIVFLNDGAGQYQLELTWLRDKEGPYDLGDNETHVAFRTDDYEAAHRLHEQMGCICYENKAMGIYFIEDPDGYWLEILPVRK